MSPALLWRGQPGYEQLRRSLCWNARVPDRYPAAIARATSRAEVAAAVATARTRGLRVSVRGSGHSWCVSALRDGGLLLDVSGLDALSVDQASGQVVAEPGVTGDRLALELERRGLAFPAGHCPGVALSGYLLGGGVGWNSGTYGHACLSITGIEAVIATGELVEADAEHNADLFWAAQGGGAAFPGAIVRYRLRSYPLPRFLAVTEWAYPLELIEDIVTWTGAAAAAMAPDGELFSWAGAGPSVAATSGFQHAVLIRGVAFADSEQDAHRILAPLSQSPLRQRGVQTVPARRCTFHDLFQGIQRLYPDGHRYAVDQMWLSREPEKVLARAAEFVRAAPSPRSQVLFYLTPQSERPLPSMAFSVADNLFLLASAIWSDHGRDAENLAWLDELVSAFEPAATGFFANETDLFRDAQRSTGCYSAANWKRLSQIRLAHDPEGLFLGYPLGEELAGAQGGEQASNR